MKKINEKLLENLTPKQRLCLAFEAQARGDENELRKLTSTCPRKTYTGPDTKFTDARDIIISLSMAVECDLRGYALLWLMSVRAGENENADKILIKMRTLNSHYANLLQDLDLSNIAIKEANLEHHFVVERLLSIPGDVEVDPAVEKIFKTVRNKISINP